MRISDWSSDVCSSDLGRNAPRQFHRDGYRRRGRRLPARMGARLKCHATAGDAGMKKNVASQIVGCQMVSATDGSAFTGSVTASVTGDGGTQATGSVEIGRAAWRESVGQYV